jgi:hypothetical protein
MHELCVELKNDREIKGEQHFHDITITAVFNAATAFTISTAIIIITAAVSIAFTVFTAIAAVFFSSISASDRLPHSVNSVRPWSYHPLAPFLQSVKNI